MHEIVLRVVSVWAEGDGGGKEGEGPQGDLVWTMHLTGRYKLSVVRVTCRQDFTLLPLLREMLLLLCINMFLATLPTLSVLVTTSFQF